jgi:hypothetical protein
MGTQSLSGSVGSLVGLSGLVTTLQNQMLQLQQQQLFRVTLKTWANHQSTVNQQLADISTSLTGQRTRLNDLQSLYMNFKYDYTEHVKVFTGHSGAFDNFTGVGGKFHTHTGATSGVPLQDPGHTV